MLKKYFSFSGRLNRKPFWLRNLALYGILLLVYLIAGLGLFGLSSGAGSFLSGSGSMVLFGILGLIFIPLIIAFYISTISLLVRRLHDRNKSGWWVLGYFAIFAIIGAVLEAVGEDSTAGLAVAGVSLLVVIWYFIDVGCLKGTAGANKYGPDPLTGSSADPSVFE